MAEDNLNQPEAPTNEGADVSTLDALHLDGKGTDRLDDAEEQGMPEASAGEKEDVKGFANVQSANRETFEKMQAGAPPEEGAVPVGDQVIPEVYTPSEPDNIVEARFENPQPKFTPEAADEGDENDAPPNREGLRPEDAEEAPRPTANGLGEDEEDGGDAPVPAAAAEELPPEALPPVVPPTITPDPDNPPVAQAPNLSVVAATGTEDIPTKLTITVSTADSDNGPETLSSISITGVPDYFTIVDGAGNPVGSLSGGTWTLTNPTQAQLDDIYLKNVDDDDDADFSGTLNLTVTATSSDTGTTATSSAPLSVTIVAVADAPGLSAVDSAGMENAWIGLDISVVDKDVGVDNSETQTLYISDLPDGASLRYTDGNGVVQTVSPTTVTGDANLPDGTYYVVPADYRDSIEVKSASNDSADFTLSVRATSTEDSNGDVAISGPVTINVDVGVVDPTATGGTYNVNEDEWAALSLSATINADMAGTGTDGAETLKVYLEDVPAGVVIRDTNTGTPLTTTTYTDADGVSHTGYDVTSYMDGNGNITGLQTRWSDANKSDAIDFNLRAVVNDVDHAEQDSDDDNSATLNDTGTTIHSLAPDIADATAAVRVTFTPVADAPNLAAAASAIGVEDKWFNLGITSSLNDTDGSESLSITVTGPANTFTLNHGTVVDNGNGTVTYTLTPAQLTGLQIKGGQDYDGNFNLTVTATSTEGVGGDTESVSTTIAVDVLSDADKPVVSVVDATQIINEDDFYNLRAAVTGDTSGNASAVQGNLTEAGSADGDTDSDGDGKIESTDGSESLTFKITAQQDSRLVIDNDGVAGISAGDTVIDLNAANGRTVEVSAKDVYDGKIFVGGKEDWASTDNTDTLKFDVVTKSTEANGVADDAIDNDTDLARSATAQSDVDTLTLKVVAQHEADTAISAANSGFEDGLTGLSDNRGDDAGTAITLTPTIEFKDLDHSEKPTGLVTITTDDANFLNGTVYLNGVALTGTANGDGTTTFTINSATFTQTGDTYVVQGLSFMPKDDYAGTIKYDVGIQAYDDDTGITKTWVKEDATISVTAVADVPVVATVNTGTMESAAGGSIPLSISVSNADNDGSEAQYVYISGVPAAAGALTVGGVAVTPISASFAVDGTNITASAGNPVYKVNAGDLADLRLSVSGNYSNDLNLTVWGVSQESSNGDVAISSPTSLRVDIGVVDPVISGNAISGNEDTYVSLAAIKANVGAADGSETLTVYVEDLNSGFGLYQNVGGTYVALTTSTYTDPSGATHTGYKIPAGLVAADGSLSGVYMKSKTANDDGDTSFTIRAVANDTDSDATPTATNTAYGQTWADTAQTTQTVTLTVNAVVDTVTPTASAVGVEDKFVALNIAAPLVDTDGSETVTVTVSGLPAGLSLYQGTTLLTPDGNGAYSFSSNDTNTLKAQLADLRVTGLVEDSNVDSYGPTTSTNTGIDLTDFTLNLSTTTTEAAGGSQTVNQVVNVKVYGDADTPTLVVTEGATEGAAVHVNEDDWYNLKDALTSISGEDGTTPTGLATTSADGSEVLYFKITATNSYTRIWIDADGDGQKGTLASPDAGDTFKELTNGESITVSAADVAAGKVRIGGDENWGNSTLEVKITPIAKETDGDTAGEVSNANAALTASNNFDNNAANDLSRAGEATGAQQSLWLRIDPVADTTTISGTASGNEDSVGITFAPTIKLTDTDGSESLTGNVEILVSGTMDGALKLSGVALTAAGTTDVGGVTYTIYNVPVGTLTYNAGTSTYTVANLKYVPNANSDLDVTYRVRTTTADAGSPDSYTTTSSIGTITVKAVADAPSISIGGMAATVVSNTTTAQTTITGSEDGYIALDLTAARIDTDGSETLTAATLTNVPAGWSVVYLDPADGQYKAYGNSGTTWTLDLNKLGNVFVHPPQDSDADASKIVFNVTTTEAATGGQVATKTATTSVAFNVVVDAVADQPNLVVSDARVLEDSLVKLDIRPSETDIDGSETLSVTIGNANGGSFWLKNANGTYTEYDAGHNNAGTWTFSEAELKNLYFKPAANSNVDVALQVNAVSTDGTSTATRTATINVVVTGVADPSNVTWVDAEQKYIAQANGTEGNVIHPHLETYVSVDTDGSESLSVVISGVPAGVTVTLDGVSTDQLKYIGNGKWSVAPDYVDNVRLIAPTNYSGTFDLSVSLITTENDGDYEKVDATLRVTVAPDADLPTGSIGGSGNEDAGVVNISLTANVADMGDGITGYGNGGIESIASITNVVVDVDLLVDTLLAKAAADAGTSVANLPPATVAGILDDVTVTYGGNTYTAQADGSGNYQITVPSVTVTPGQTSVTVSGLALHGVPANWAKDFNIKMTVTAQDGADTQARDISGKVVVKAVADEPNLVIDADTDATPLVHDYANGTMVVGGHTITTHEVTLTGDISVADTALYSGDNSESLYLKISGVPNGVLVEGGINNGDGSWTVPGGTEIASIKLVATSLYSRTDANGDNIADDVTLTIKAVVTDVDPDGGSDTEDGSVSVVVNFGDFGGSGGSENLPPIPTGDITGTITGTEDGAVALSQLKPLISVVDGNGDPLIVGANGVASDGSTVSVALVVPKGWSISGSGYYQIDAVDTDANGSADTFTYSVPYSALGSVTLTPPKDFAGDTNALQARVVVTTADGRYDTASAALQAVPVKITPVVDGPSVQGNIDHVAEDGADAGITLTITDIDIDNSESLNSNVIKIRIADEGGKVTGELTADGSGGFTMSAGVHGSGYTEYTVTVTDTSLFNSSGIVLSGLHFNPANDYSGTVGLQVLVEVKDQVTVDGGATTLTDVQTKTSHFQIVVDAVVDDSVFTPGVNAGIEDQSGGIALNMEIQHSDVIAAGTDWSTETMSVIISGVPTGASLTGAYNNGNGTWTVKDSSLSFNTSTGKWELQGVKFVPAQDNSADANLTVTTFAKEAGTNTWVEDSSAPFTVVVAARADGATVNPQNVSGTEDVLLALDLGVQVLDASETAIITITGVPLQNGITDAAGNAVGTWTQTGSTWTVTVSATEVRSLDLLGSGKLYFDGATHVAGTWTMGVSVVSVDDDADSFNAGSGTYGDTVRNTDTSASSGSFAFTVTLAADADAPTLNVTANTVSGNEDTAITLNIADARVDTDGSETLSLTIAGAPAGTKFLATTNGTTWTEHTVNTEGGSVTISGTLTNVKMVPPADYNGTVNLSLTATATEANGDTASTSQNLQVTVVAVNDAPTLALSGVAGLGIAAGAHNAAMHLMHDASVLISDVDGTALQSMSLHISGAKAGDALGLSGVSPAFDGSGNMTVSVNGKTFTVTYNDSTDTLTFSNPAASFADYQAIVNTHVIFTSSTGTLLDGMRNVDVTVTDSTGGVSGSLSIPVTVDEAGSATPTTVSGDALGSVYFGDDGAHLNGTIPVTAGLDIADGASINQMTVTLDGLTGDSLALSGMTVSVNEAGLLEVSGNGITSGITVSFDSGSNALIFSGSGSATDYETIADSIILSSEDGTLDAGSRDITVALSDGSTSTFTTNLSSNLALEGEAAGEVHWNSDGSAVVDDTMIVPWGYDGSLDGGSNGIDALMVQYNNGSADSFDWTFTVVDGGDILATAADDASKSFIVDIQSGTANVSEDQNSVVFSTDADGQIVFQDALNNTSSTMHFDNIERLLG